MKSSFFTHQVLFSQVLWTGIAFILLTGTGFAQVTPNRQEMVFTIVEQNPEFPGGSDALKEFMRKNVRYPAEAQKAGIKGRVFVSFIVEPDGSLTDVQLLTGIGYGCDEEALWVVEAMPHWTPGTQSGKPLRVKYKLPVLFGIDYPILKVR